MQPTMMTIPISATLYRFKSQFVFSIEETIVTYTSMASLVPVQVKLGSVNRTIRSHIPMLPIAIANAPTPKTAKIDSLVLTRVFKCHTPHAGRSKAPISESWLPIPDAKSPATLLIHVPWTDGFQIASRGTHWKRK